MTISRKSRLPLYSQIRQKFEQDILEGTLQPGERLPSEDALAARFEVSRMTVRRAIDQLVSAGKLKRVQGQGTFVVEPPPKSQPAGITRWSFERIEQRQDTRQKVVNIEEISPSLRVANALHSMLGEPIIQVTRLFYLADEPLGYCLDHIPKLILSNPDIETWDLDNKRLIDFLGECCKLEFGKVTERVRAVPAAEDAVELLGVEPGSPLLYVDSLIFLASGIPVILTDTWYRGDSYVYRGILHPILEKQKQRG